MGGTPASSIALAPRLWLVSPKSIQHSAKGGGTRFALGIGETESRWGQWPWCDVTPAQIPLGTPQTRRLP